MYRTHTKYLHISISEHLVNHRKGVKSHWFIFLLLYVFSAAEMIETAIKIQIGSDCNVSLCPFSLKSRLIPKKIIHFAFIIN